jgi:hypothetical protein
MERPFARITVPVAVARGESAAVWRFTRATLAHDPAADEHGDALVRHPGGHRRGRVTLAFGVAAGWLWSMVWSILHTMETVQIVIEASLLDAADRAARRLGMNRSALIRAALREHLRRLEALERERRDREGYLRRPAAAEEFAV